VVVLPNRARIVRRDSADAATPIVDPLGTYGAEMFGSFNLDAMNETDVREIIVRPLLHELGYRQGTEATIKTEISFRYGKAFLGRKKPDTDPDLAELRGRADYICEVISYGRWVVEAKAPGEAFTIDDAQQAHTYAAHPEVAAIFYLVTNGREFVIAQPGLRHRLIE